MSLRSMSRSLALALIVLSAQANAGPITVSLATSKDNTVIQQTNPSTQLSNGQGDIFVGRTNQDGQGPATISIRRGLIAFDIAGNLPAGATITKVTLTMRDVMGLNGDPVVELHRSLQDWGEGSSFFSGGVGAPAENNDATWLYTFYNKANPAASPTWSTPGGNYSGTVSGSAVVSDDLGGGQLFTWSSTQMIADVQDWLNNPGNNFGWFVLGDETKGQTAKRLNSGESSSPPNVPPVLAITYVVPEPSSLALCAFAAVGVALSAGRRRQPMKTQLG